MNTDDQSQQPSNYTPTGDVHIPIDKSEEINNDSPSSPNEESERGVSGSMADPESDDDMLKNEQEVGLYTYTTDDEAPELNIADQIEKAEKYHRDH